MTLAIALRARGGLVMASDSRMTVADPAHGILATRDFSDKFLQVNRDVGVMTYGLAEPGNRGILRLVAEAAKDRRAFATYPGVVESATPIFRSVWEEFVSESGSPPQGTVAFVVGGYDMVETNQYRVTHFSLAGNFAAEPRDQPVFLSAQWHLSQYLADLLYSQEMTVDTVKELAVLMLTATGEASPGVGGPIQLATVTAATGFRQAHEDEILSVLSRNESRFALLKGCLLRQFLRVREQEEGNDV